MRKTKGPEEKAGIYFLNFAFGNSSNHVTVFFLMFFINKQRESCIRWLLNGKVETKLIFSFKLIVC